MTDASEANNTEIITNFFTILRKVIDVEEKALKQRIYDIEEKNKQSVEEYHMALINTGKRLDEQKSSLDSMTSTNDHIKLLQNKDQLTINFDNISQQLDELKLPNRTECRIEGLDQLLTHVDTMVQQIGRIIQISGMFLVNEAISFA
ncbi:unnamed protein product [Adineta steineri]|uniref:Uncharacterized protein n=1 Tax=Adineta steineri TaxID=433720 RepID=A0A819KQV6_9BILA|nr:unnamed protein product [Adineta steineri]CAF3953264.1 unnamed protein product [Adineta steineri]